MPEITTVLFDLGGVVCRYDLRQRHEALAADSGLTVEEVRTRLDALDNAAFDRGEYTSERWYALLREAIGIKMSLDELRRVSALAFVPDAGVLRVVDAIRGHARTALFTNNPSLLREALPQWLPDVNERFDALLFTYMLGYTKPALEAFAAALDRLASHRSASCSWTTRPPTSRPARARACTRFCSRRPSAWLRTSKR